MPCSGFPRNADLSPNLYGHVSARQSYGFHRHFRGQGHIMNCPYKQNQIVLSFCPQNWLTMPSSSQASYRLRRLFYALHQKPSRAHSAAPPLRIKPACGWALIRFFVAS